MIKNVQIMHTTHNTSRYLLTSLEKNGPASPGDLIAILIYDQLGAKITSVLHIHIHL